MGFRPGHDLFLQVFVLSEDGLLMSAMNENRCLTLVDGDVSEGGHLAMRSCNARNMVRDGHSAHLVASVWPRAPRQFLCALVEALLGSCAILLRIRKEKCSKLFSMNFVDACLVLACGGRVFTIVGIAVLGQ